MAVLLLVAGFALLMVGGDTLVRGASGLAIRLGIAPLVVGLTVVAFGTSAPELAVSSLAALRGQADLAVGNVVGSNLLNILLILGLSAMVAPLLAAREVVRRDVPLMIGASLLVVLLALDGAIGRIEGLVLVGLLLVYVVTVVRGTAVPSKEAAAAASAPRPLWRLLAELAVGLVLLVVGSHWLVEGAVALARAAGISELVIGLTVVALGTSLPEVVSSIVATIRGERDIAIGNVVGSNIFNLLLVLGGAAALSPAGVAVAPGALRFDLPVMLAVAVATFPIVLTGGRIDRWEGALFLAYYVGYTAFVALEATGHHWVDPFGAVALGFIVPITTLALVVLALRELRHRRRG